MATVTTLPDENDVVILELDRPRVLSLNHRALKRFSALTGCAMDEIEAKVKHYDQMSALLWVMVTDEQMDLGEPLMTPEALDAMLNKHKISIKQVLTLCGQAIEAAFKDEDDEETEGGSDNPPLKAAGAGVEA